MDRLRRKREPETVTPAAVRPADARREQALRAILAEDPNDIPAFAELAELVREHAAQGFASGYREFAGFPRPAGPEVAARAADDAVWALAEELAHSGRAWFPLLELARLSINEDREQALRRLETAAERDPSGKALAMALALLRDAGLPGDALGLGVGHWRPREHDVDAGRQLVEAAVEAGRTGEARRHLEALSLHPDEARVAAVQADLERLLARSEAGRPRTIDLRDHAPHEGWWSRVLGRGRH